MRSNLVWRLGSRNLSRNCFLKAPQMGRPLRSLAKVLLMVASGASNGSEVAVRIVHPSRPDEVREVTAASCSGRFLSPKHNRLWLQLFLLFPNKGLGFEVDPGDDIKPWLAAVAANGRLCVSCDARVLRPAGF